MVGEEGKEEEERGREEEEAGREEEEGGVEDEEGEAVDVMMERRETGVEGATDEAAA